MFSPWRSSLDLLGYVIVHENVRSFYPRVDEGISLTLQAHHFSKPFRKDDYPLSLPEIGPVGQSLVEKLLGIPGIANLSINVHRVVVHIRPIYTWDEVTPQVASVFAAVYGWDEVPNPVDLTPKPNDMSVEGLFINKLPPYFKKKGGLFFKDKPETE